jgi:hypothetical protein
VNSCVEFPSESKTIGNDVFDDPILQSLVLLLTFVLLGLAARLTALIAAAYWDHFVTTLYFDSKL